jgi:hypothetical protein
MVSSFIVFQGLVISWDDVTNWHVYLIVPFNFLSQRFSEGVTKADSLSLLSGTLRSVTSRCPIRLWFLVCNFPRPFAQILGAGIVPVCLQNVGKLNARQYVIQRKPTVSWISKRDGYTIGSCSRKKSCRCGELISIQMFIRRRG